MHWRNLLRNYRCKWVGPLASSTLHYSSPNWQTMARCTAYALRLCCFMLSSALHFWAFETVGRNALRCRMGKVCRDDISCIQQLITMYSYIRSWWGPKVLCWLSLVVVSFFIPNGFFMVWGNYFALIGAAVFILFGLVLLVDFAHSWTEHCLENYEMNESSKWKYFLIGKLPASVIVEASS